MLFFLYQIGKISRLKKKILQTKKKGKNKRENKIERE